MLSEPAALMNEVYVLISNTLPTHSSLNLACLSLIYFIHHQVSKSRLLICSPVLSLNAVDKVINPCDNDLSLVVQTDLSYYNFSNVVK